MDIYDAWNDSLEEIKRQVTGVNTWTALNMAVPVALEDGVFVLGLPRQETALIGHLRMAGTQRVIESELSKRLGSNVRLDLIEGITINDWEAKKRRDAEAEKVRARDSERYTHERMSAQAWEEVYESLSREYAATQNKAMPQFKADLLERCVRICAEAVGARELDDAEHRNFARCLDRIGQYCDVPSAIVARLVLERTGKS